MKKNNILIIFLMFTAFVLNTEAVELKYNNMIKIHSGYYLPFFKKEKFNPDLDKIYVKSFYLDQYLVINSNFKYFLESNPIWKKSKEKNIFFDDNYLLNFDININNKPITYVSWYAADAYCKWLDKRLPTTDEIEYIVYISKIFQDNFELDYFNKNIKYFIDNSNIEIPFINDLKKNSFNIYGMNDFIWEWVSDFNSNIIFNGNIDEGGDLNQFLYCGVAAISSIDPNDYIAFLRYAFRNSLEGKDTISNLSFRCARSII